MKVTKSKLTSLINEEVKRRIRAKLLESQLKETFKPSRYDNTSFPVGEDDEQGVSFPSGLDRQTAIDSQRPEGLTGNNEFEAFAKYFLDTARHRGYDLNQLVDYVTQHKDEIKADFESGDSADDVRGRIFSDVDFENLKKSYGDF